MYWSVFKIRMCACVCVCVCVCGWAVVHMRDSVCGGRIVGEKVNKLREEKMKGSSVLKQKGPVSEPFWGRG